MFLIGHRINGQKQRLCSVPSIILDHVRELDDELPLLVLLTGLKCLLVFPAQCSVTALTVDICHSMQACQKQSFLSWTTPHIHHRVEKVGPSLASLERLGDEVIVVGQVSAAVYTAVPAMTEVQVCLKSLGLGQFHHV